MNEAIRYAFLSDWVKKASQEEIIEKLIEHDERGKEIERLKNIINELEKSWKEQQKYYLYRKDNRYRAFLSKNLDRLKELKGDSSNE